MPTLRELAEYHKPATLDEALKLLRRTRIKTVPLAGGTSLVPGAARDVQAVVDLAALDLSFVRQGQGLQLGATTRLQALADHEAVRAYADGVLGNAILDSASRHTREAASLAGSIVAAPGNSPLFTALLALDARLIVRTARSTREDEIALFKSADAAACINHSTDACIAVFDGKSEAASKRGKTGIEREFRWNLSAIYHHLSAMTYPGEQGIYAHLPCPGRRRA